MVSRDEEADSPPEARTNTRRDRRRALVREEIMEATRAILMRDGIASFTLDAVARELQLTKTALYYYFPSKEALLFEAMSIELRSEADAIAAAVESATSGAEALRALVEAVFGHYDGRMDAFRLAYLYGQVNGANTGSPTPEMLERVRPINHLVYGSVQRKLEIDGEVHAADTDPRRLAFLAHMAAVGLLTFKGLVEAHDDPLIHRDADLREDLIRVLEAASRPPR